MPDVGILELLIVLAIVVLLFGATRVADLGGALGRAIREFRRGLGEEESEKRGTTKEPEGDPPNNVER